MASARTNTPVYAHASVFGAMDAGASVGWVPRDPLCAEAAGLAEAFPSAGPADSPSFLLQIMELFAVCSLDRFAPIRTSLATPALRF